MQLVATLSFLTLVSFGFFSQATTTEPSPDFRDKDAQEKEIQVDQTKVQLTHPTQPPPLSADQLRRAAPYFYRYRSDFSVSSNLMWGNRLDSDKTAPVLISGLHHQFANANLKSYELSGEVISDGTGLLSLARKWNLSRGRLRPFYQLGLSILIDPDDQFATVLYLKHYLIRAGAGFEYSFGGSFSLRADLLALLGAGSQQAGAGLALVWGF